MQTERRKRVRQLADSSGGAHNPPYDGSATASGVFALLDDDVALLILERLAWLDPELEGEAWQKQRRATARSVAALTSTCRALRRVLVHSSNQLYAELLARGATDVHPRQALDARPYLQQVEDEQRSARQFRALRYTDDQMAFHCAGNCCEQARASAERKIRGRGAPPSRHAIHTLSRRAGDLAAASHAPVAYMRAQRGRKGIGAELQRWEIGSEGSPPSLTHTLLTSEEDGAQPDVWCMAPSRDGSMVAWVIPVRDGFFEHDQLALRVWAPATNEVHAIGCQRVTEYDAEVIGGNEDLDDELTNPVAIWWTLEGALRVAWSTTEVHPTGTDGHDGKRVEAWERYLIASYVHDAEHGGMTLDDCCGPFWGRLISVSADESGERCVAYVRQRPLCKAEAHYVAMVHHRGCAEALSHPHVWKGDRKGGGPAGYDWGPSAVGISPRGDCVVVVHRTLGTVTAEIFTLDAEMRYVRVGACALTEWLRLDGDRPRTGDNAVKLRYRVGFSPCGRFATVVDQRARWGYEFTGYTCVTMDLSQRRRDARIACQPMGYSERSGTAYVDHTALVPSTMRGLEWTHGGAWVLASSGALLVAP